MTDDPGHPANPYAGEAATAPRLADREGYPFAASRTRVDLSDEAQLGTPPCAVCGTPIAQGEAVRDRRGGPWHRLCVPVGGMPTPAAKPMPQPPELVHVIRGRVKFMNAVKGYGFIAREDGPDVFIHRETLRASGFTDFIPGSGCGIEVEAVHHHDGSRGLITIRVRWIEWHP
jgi:CspA family cold shock protein